NTTALIYQLDIATGTTIRSFAAPALAPSGMAIDGRTLWLNDVTLRTTYQVSMITGTVIRSFVSPSTHPIGLAFDGRTLWLVDRDSDLVYQIDIG
ncbi:unnamed protein product, partial [marine sediment metagenome]